ncbi:MAG: hypothetical protein R3B90_16135 [Planctomycetaceae bacterium]
MLLKTCAAQEIGPDGVTMLTFIVHTEDAAHYRRPVAFFNEQLAAICGMSVASMKRTREKCINGRWMGYVPGAKRRAAKYWVLVPDFAAGLDDHPTDDDEAGDIPAQAEPLSEPAEEIVAQKMAQSEPATVQKAAGKRATYIPEPVFIPKPLKGGGEVSAADCKIVVDSWNAVEGVTACRKLTDDRVRKLRTRLADSDWRDNWREALDRVSRSPFCIGGGDRGWRADFDWFIRPDTLTKILEGRFDDLRSSNIAAHRGLMAHATKHADSLDDELSLPHQKVKP